MFEGLHLWKPFIFKTKFDFSPYFDQIYEGYQDSLRHWATHTDTTRLESGDSNTTCRVGYYDYDKQPHEQIGLRDFNCFLGSILPDVWGEYGFIGAESQVTRSWYNRHGLHGQTMEHAHTATELVVSAYVSNDKGQGFIEFRDPLEYHKSGFPYDAEKNIWKSVECYTNDVLIFPGWLNHRTQENSVGGERICMTYNLNARMRIDDVKGKFRL
jgi:hypothetical protein